MEYVSLGPSERRRLVVVSEDGRPIEPAYLFVSERGTPVSAGVWGDVFQAASARCRAFGRPMLVTPHVLRHSYAVHLLSDLIKQLRERAALPETAAPGTQVYEELLGDALMELQERLGHASITSTYGYLRCVKQVRRMGDAAAIALAGAIYDEEDDS